MSTSTPEKVEVDVHEGAQGLAPAALRPAKSDDTGEVLGRLFGYVAGKGRRGRFWAAVALRSVSVVALTTVPAATGGAVNAMSATPPNVTDLRAWVLLGAAAMVVFAFTAFIAERMLARLATEATAHLQRDMFETMQGLSLSYFDRQPVGQLMSRVSNDTEVVATFNETAASSVLKSLFQIVLIVILMFFTNWRLTLAALVVVPLMLLVAAGIARATLPVFTLLQEQLGDLSAFQEETISGHKVIISSGRQQWAVDGNEKGSGGVFETGAKATFTSLLQLPVTQTLTVVQMVVVLVVGGILSAGGQADVGEVIAFVGMASLLAQPSVGPVEPCHHDPGAIAAGRRVFQTIDEKPTVVDVPGARDFEFGGGKVEFRHVDFSYVPGRRILHDNNFEALPGQKIGICGPTGAGKSTIINILTRYYDIDDGDILMDGQDLSTLTAGQPATPGRHGAAGGVPLLRHGDEQPQVRPRGRHGRGVHRGCPSRPTPTSSSWTCRQGYDTVLTERGANLSQGQRQMLTIARAMVADPKILILDEATCNVDTRTEQLIQEGLARLMAGAPASSSPTACPPSPTPTASSSSRPADRGERHARPAAGRQRRLPPAVVQPVQGHGGVTSARPVAASLRAPAPTRQHGPAARTRHRDGWAPRRRPAWRRRCRGSGS